MSPKHVKTGLAVQISVLELQVPVAPGDALCLLMARRVFRSHVVHGSHSGTPDFNTVSLLDPLCHVLLFILPKFLA